MPDQDALHIPAHATHETAHTRPRDESARDGAVAASQPAAGVTVGAHHCATCHAVRALPLSLVGPRDYTAPERELLAHLRRIQALLPVFPLRHTPSVPTAAGGRECPK